MGEPKMPDYNSPEWQEKIAQSRENQKQPEKRDFKKSLLTFVEKLRNGTAGDYGYKNIVEGFFNSEKSILMVASRDGSIPFEVKREIIDNVLEETRLTQEEAKELVEKIDSKEYSDGITQLVSELREGKMENMSFRGVNAVDTFFDPNLEPATLPWYIPTGDFITSEKKREIISKVLTETGLTEEEARGFLASKNQK
jgi:hypothetical protein